ncbi:hypothetical protein ACJMK2_023084 [Sinanodonta woodiana]|uniref:Corticotropin-releasing factor receptor 1 n=1 Tax=Sinanodonta woodiana TaxID=1069815 RepID=A0ABD3T328_SINWO
MYCNVSWDEYSCWPATPGGTYAVIPCPGYLVGIDEFSNATKYCNANGTWAPKATYDSCVRGPVELESWGIGESHLRATRIIYNVGFTLSTLALAVALAIFLYFRSLRCLRNIIHCHLIVTFILMNVIWIIMKHSLIPIRDNDHLWLCKLEVTLFKYSQGTNFFWMFVEGLYLHIIIVWTYSADKIRMWYLLVIGWGMPAAFVIAWAVVKKKLQDVNCWLPEIHDEISLYDFIFTGPILFVLFVNILFLSSIIWILITKLRASHSWELRQYRKAVKATIILIPLLGITYVLFIAPPSDVQTVKTVFLYINAVLQSFQGFFVAVFYCFLNGEVRSVLKKKFNRFNDARSLSTKFTKTSVGWTRGSRSSRDYGQSIALSNGNAIVTTENRKTTETAWKNEDNNDLGEREEMLNT